ncbi:MAG TPA: glutamate 5-kinase, partial [Xanthomonadaceae bacterium]|nr:glutamate 5-kinase [Xanthomonadaceae bacterium]
MTVDAGPTRFSEQPLTPWRRAVLKVGSSLLAAEGGGLSPRHVEAIAGFVRAAHSLGREVVLVSSGAVAAGRALSPSPTNGSGMAERQALAALGQAKLMGFWQGFFEPPVAQVLLTHDDLRNRRRYLNARATLTALLSRAALPIVNENDTVSVDELKLGDNDNLAGVVAALVDADILLIATDVDGLYDRDPRRHGDARPVEQVAIVDAAVMASAGAAGSAAGTGGMVTKLEAAARAARAGIATALFNGRAPAVLEALARDRLIGTWIAPSASRVVARKHWLLSAPLEAGAVVLDAGAAQAVAGQGASLLAGGIAAVEGDFRRGDAVLLVCRGADGERRIARGIAQY